MSEYWYRFEDIATAPKSGVIINLCKYKVMKQTPMGVWLEYGYDKDKFVRRDARKHFACPTVEEAKISFIARKKRQLGILEAQAKGIRKVLVFAESLMEKEALSYDRAAPLGI